eukprot:6206871-Pleurochrysis_carterae.AAC.1
MSTAAYPCRWMALHADDLAKRRHAAAVRHCPCLYGEAVRQRCKVTHNSEHREYPTIIQILTMPLVAGVDLNGTASGDPTDL